jgi:hypothetical protein
MARYIGGSVLDCDSCGHSLFVHDVVHEDGEAACIAQIREEDLTDGDHRGGCPPISKDHCGCYGYQAPRVFSLEEVLEMLRAAGRPAPVPVADR